MTKECLHCGKKFKVVVKWALYCSVECEIEASETVPKPIKKEA